MTVKIKVEGKVQGVFFRATTKTKAVSLGLKGYVSNETDGSVSIFACGEKDQLNELLTWCETGVDMARVDNIEHEFIDEMQFHSFYIKR